MKNKTIIYKVLSSMAAMALVCGAMTSCEAMLGEDPYGFLTEAPDSDEGADMYVTGAYSYLLDDMFRWDEFPKVLELDCDYATGPEWSLKYLGAGNFQHSEGSDPMWYKCFALIHKCNNAMEKIGEMQNVTPAHKANTIGEMKFLKAYSYFLLVRAFGDVPIFENSINLPGVTYDQPRKPIADVYGYIIDMLEEAEAGLYKNTDSNYKTGHVSEGAASSLLAKVYLTIASSATTSASYVVKGGPAFDESTGEKMNVDPIDVNVSKAAAVAGYEDFVPAVYFELARDKAKEVIDGEHGEYDLLPYESLWDKNFRNKVEHIWGIEGVSASDQYGLHISRYYTGQENSSGVIIQGLWHGCSNHWYQLFEDNDLRITEGVRHRWIHQDHVKDNLGAYYPNTREMSIKARGGYDNGGTWVSVDPVTGEPYVKDPEFNDGRAYFSKDASPQFIAFLNKYYDAADRTNERTDVGWPVIRFADVLLIYAEASNELSGPNNDAINAINKVRNRSNASSVSMTTLANKESFRSFVLEERARELALEGDRRWDLLRWGGYLTVMNAYGGYDEAGIKKTREQKHLLYPIPSDEILSNKNINSNNPGW